MSKKPTYEELEQRVKELEKESGEYKRAKEALQEKERELSIRNWISHLFLTSPDDEMYGEVLQVVLEAMKSKYGVFGYINNDGALVCPSMTRDIWDQCQIPNKEIVFTRETWGGIWGKSLIDKKALYSNEPFGVPQGHIPIFRALNVPIIDQGEVIGNLLVGNKKTNYDEKDQESLETIADHIAPVLHARLQRDTQEKERKRAEEALQRHTHALSERVKELNCLLGISRLLEKPNITLEEIFQGILQTIPPAWQYPEITCARITMGSEEFKTENFRETPWALSDDILVYGRRVGSMEVYCLQEKPEKEDSPFLKEERKLLHAIAERLGKIIEGKRAEEQIHALTQELMRAQESERQMISRELHDRVGQDLSSLMIGFATLFDCHPEVPSEIRRKVSEFSRLLWGTIMTVRDLSYDLRPPSLDRLGLVQTISQCCEDFSEKKGINVDFFSAGLENLKLHFDTEINLYRLVQEGLNNIKKHANASHATVKLVASSPNIILRIEDNGKGFDVKKRLAVARREKRMGLQSMEERVKLLNGKMSIRSSPMKGTKLFIEVPQ